MNKLDFIDKHPILTIILTLLIIPFVIIIHPIKTFKLITLNIKVKKVKKVKGNKGNTK